MLCPVCRGGAVYLNFPGVGTLRGLDTDHWTDSRLYEWSLVRIWWGPRRLSLENGGDGHRVKVAKWWPLQSQSCLVSSGASSLLCVSSEWLSWCLIIAYSAIYKRRFFKIYWKENLEFGHQCENSPLFTGNMFRLDITPLCVSIPILLCVRLCVGLCDSGVGTETRNNQAVRL